MCLLLSYSDTDRYSAVICSQNKQRACFCWQTITSNMISSFLGSDMRIVNTKCAWRIRKPEFNVRTCSQVMRLMFSCSAMFQARTGCVCMRHNKFTWTFNYVAIPQIKYRVRASFIHKNVYKYMKCSVLFSINIIPDVIILLFVVNVPTFSVRKFIAHSRII